VVDVEARRDVRIVVDDGPWSADAGLRAGGGAHLTAPRARSPRLHDGPVLAMTSIRGGLVRARVGTYFDMVATADALAADARLRDRAVALAGGDPLRCGAGRMAAIGLSVAAVLADGRVVLGRRRDDLPLDPGRWHVVPSGMLEPGSDPVGEALEREAREELGVEVARSAARVLGLGWDLARLRPEVCLALDLDGEPDVAAAGGAGGEYDAFAAFAPGAAPGALTAGAACALALLLRCGDNV
jgi:8-oxo-dGTP pyrophosphatase MutT (NUDIX family)